MINKNDECRYKVYCNFFKLCFKKLKVKTFKNLHFTKICEYLAGAFSLVNYKLILVNYNIFRKVSVFAKYNSEFEKLIQTNFTSPMYYKKFFTENIL